MSQQSFHPTNLHQNALDELNQRYGWVIDNKGVAHKGATLDAAGNATGGTVVDSIAEVVAAQDPLVTYLRRSVATNQANHTQAAAQLSAWGLS